jgi:hypothetical protein
MAGLRELQLARRIQVTYLLAATAAIVGVVNRWLFHTGSAGRIHADEAVAGLMARDLLNGEWSTFFWGQQYGGTAELIVLAPALAIFGSSALLILPLIEAIVLTVFVFAYCQHLLSKQDALLVASLVWAAPTLWQWFSLRPMLFYQPTLILGFMLLVLLHPKRRADRWFISGIVTGVGWWTSPQILFFAIPAFATCGLPCTKLRNLIRITAGFCVGAAPWIATNLATQLASIRSQPPRSGSFVDHLTTQLSTGWPMAFGLRLPFDEKWIFDSAPLLFIAIATLFLAAALITYRTHRRAIAGALGVIPVFIVLQALAPTGSHVGTGRYYIFVVPSIAIVMIAASSARTGLATISRGVIVVMMLTLSFTGTLLSRDRRMEPTGVEMIAAELVDQELLHIRADYWSSYLLAWYEPDLVVTANHTDRQPLWTAAVDDASEVAEVFWLGVDYERKRFDKFMAGNPSVISSEMIDDWAIVVVNQRP